jgi:DNA-binding response OmpR family regulator
MRQAKILVVDDETGILDIVSTNLEAAGYEVLTSADGAGGLELATRESPDLIILDIMMPKMDGWEVLRRLEKDPATAGLPVIMLTAKVDDIDVLEGLKRGAVEYITKPFFPENLIASVKINLSAYDAALRDERRSKLIERRKWILEQRQHTEE